MDIENEIFRIFSALDSKNQGFIDKNDLLEKMLNYLSNFDENEEKRIIEIERIIKPYSKIGVNEFQSIYLQIQELTVDSGERMEQEKVQLRRRESLESDGSSDIDEVGPESGRKNMSEEILTASARQSQGEFHVAESILQSSPGSASKHGKQLLNHSKSLLDRMINGPLVMEQGEYTERKEDERSAQVESLQESNEKMQHELDDLRRQLQQEEKRCNLEKDQKKASNAKIFQLENLVHDLETQHKLDMKKTVEQCRSKLQSMEAEVEEVRSSVDSKLADMERQLSVLQRDNDDLLVRCKKLSLESEDLHKECRRAQFEKQQNETILMEYKRVANEQVTELQSERDQLELINTQLYSELQTIKHLSPPDEKVNRHRSMIDESVVNIRERALSDYRLPKESLKRHSSELSRKDKRLSKSQSDAIESDSNRIVQLLTMENRNLMERIAHLETVGFYQRQKLEAANCLSLAAEMEQLNIDELKKALTVERETVITLQKYMESLTNKLLLAGYIDVFQQC